MKTLVVVATPHVGTLDSWLPVIAEARERHSDWEIVIVLPRPERVVTTLNPEDGALSLIEQIANRILVLGLDGRLYAVQSFKEARDLSRRQWRLGTQVAGLPLLRGRVGSLEPRPDEHWADSKAQWFFRRLIRLAFSVRYWRHRARVAMQCQSGSSVVCTDFTKVDRPSVAVAVRMFGAAPRLSIEHGIGAPLQVEDTEVLSPDEMRRAGASVENLYRAYCYHDTMAQTMVRRFGLPVDRIAVTGIPRHDPEALAWRHEVGARDSRPVIPVISNPTTSPHFYPQSADDYLPREFKQAMLREIHSFACGIGAMMLVRLHPSEARSESLREIAEALPRAGEGESWSFTSAHPSTLAVNAPLAVTFSSTVKADFVAAGVPVVDLWPGHPVPVCTEALAGLAIIVHDLAGLSSALRAIADDRERVLNEQQAAYGRRYANPSGSVDRILRDIEGRLSE